MSETSQESLAGTLAASHSSGLLESGRSLVLRLYAVHDLVGIDCRKFVGKTLHELTTPVFLAVAVEGARLMMN